MIGIRVWIVLNMEVATIQKKEKILFVTSGNGNTQEAGLINNNKK